MPLQKLKFRPGVNREATTLANEGGWFDCDKVRFRSGYPEKIGGWVLDTGKDAATLQPPAGAYWGVCRTLFNWVTTTGYNLLALGTNLKYYIQSSTGGYLNDITPIRSTLTLSSPFTTTATSSKVNVYAAGHGAQTGDFITFSSVSAGSGNVTTAILNSEFQITYVDSNNFSITVPVVANTSTSNFGGAGISAVFQITTGNTIFTYGTGWGAGAWGGTTTGVATTTLNGSITNSATSIVLTSASGFPTTGTVLIDNELITYSGVSTNTLTGCTRGTNGTLAAAHSSGATVQNSATFEAWNTSAASNIGLQLRTWTQSNFGDYLVFNPRGGSLYIWTTSTNPNIFSTGQLLGPSATITTPTGNVNVDSSCPSVANGVIVSDASRFVIAYGVNDYGSTVQNPMLIRWSDQESFATWLPAVTNQAGSYTLSHGSTILSAIQTRQEILVFTDAAVYSMQYIGAPYVWGFQLMGSNTSFTSPNAVATVNNVTYWMGADRFYQYSGRVETLPCTLRQYIFDNINMSQAYQFFSGTNEGYNEVWWFYVSVTGTNADGSNGSGTYSNPNTVVDRYVIYNHLEQTWYYGKLQRTAWFDSPLRQYPMAAGYNGQLIYHENGVDDGTTSPASPIASYVTSSDFDIGDGNNFGFAWRMIPDMNFDGSNVANPSVTYTIQPRQNPGGVYGPDDTPTVTSAQNYSQVPQYLVQQFTQQIYIRARGRQMALKVSSNGLGVQWQLGVPRLDVRPDGRR